MALGCTLCLEHHLKSIHEYNIYRKVAFHGSESSDNDDSYASHLEVDFLYVNNPGGKRQL